MIRCDPEFLTAVAYPVGILFAVAMLALFIHATKKAGVRKAA